MPVTRQELQIQAVDRLLTDRRVIVNWGTGVGKSRVGIECIRRIWCRGRKRILLLVTEDAHKTNWRNEFVEALREAGGRLYDSITVECYASLPKYRNTSWDIIVADEAHHMRSELRTDIISTMTAEYFLCLSATISCNGDAAEMLSMLERRFGHFTSLDFGIQDAIDNGILGEPRIYVHTLPLEDLNFPMTIVEEWGSKKKRVEIQTSFKNCGFYYKNKDRFPAVTLHITGTPKECYDFYCGRIEYLKKQWQSLRKAEKLEKGQPDNEKTAFAYNRFIHYCSLRKILIGRMKTPFCRALLEKLSNKKLICFCTDVQQGRDLGGSKIICTENDSLYGHGYNAEVIKKFNSGENRKLFAVNMIQEGQNLAGIEVGIIVQLGGKDRQFIQKLGRVMRSKTPVQHIVLINGTKDVDYYHTAIAGIKKKKDYITIVPYGTLRLMMSEGEQTASHPSGAGPVLSGVKAPGAGDGRGLK